ncbi:MAG: xanthine dehydrogenase accessory protein XdhC [Pseudomonas sp.]
MTFEEFLAGATPRILIEVTRTRGSTPRETGAFMLVAADSLWGTIGGGHMEFDAVDAARAMLVDGRAVVSLDVTLGPDSGQCCGGRVELRLSRANEHVVQALRDRLAVEADSNPAVYIFGSGHVGRALALALAPLPFNVTVVETRQEELDLLDPRIARRLESMPESVVTDIPEGGMALIMTHDHALDFLIGAEALKRSDLRYVGMIGSRTKRGVFAGWLRDSGFDADRLQRLVLPIGSASVKDKRPAVIAALVAAELLSACLGSSGQGQATIVG